MSISRAKGLRKFIVMKLACFYSPCMLAKKAFTDVPIYLAV